MMLPIGSVGAQRRKKKPLRQMVNDITRKETKQRRGRETQNTGKRVRVQERETADDTWEEEHTLKKTRLSGSCTV